MSESAAPEPVYGKPFHGWSCECDECQGYDERGEPRPGEAPATSAAICGIEWCEKPSEPDSEWCLTHMATATLIHREVTGHAD